MGPNVRPTNRLPGRKMDSHDVEDLLQETYDETFDLRALKEEQQREAGIIPCTQQEESQETIKKARGRSKGAPKNDIKNNGEVVEVLDFQPIAVRNIRTETERRPSRRQIEINREKEGGSCHALFV